jgi:type IV secretory pathway VirB10-like protein
MLSNRLALAAVGLTCVAAAAGGGYLASRHDVQPAPAVAAAEPVPAAAPSAPAVQETEAVVAPSPLVAAPPAVAETTPVSRRAEATARPAPRPARRAEAAPARNTQPPPLERTWPASATSSSVEPQANGGAQASSASEAPAQSASANDQTLSESAHAPEAPAPSFEELVVSANSVVGLQLEGALSSDRASVEDRVEARVVRDVRVGNTVAIPSGSRAIGSVMVVERGGRFKDRARLGIRFHTLVLADGTRLPITSETIYRTGDAPGNASAAKIGGGAVGGAILGAIIGGAKGAAIGATAGAGGGTAAVMASEPKAATFPAGTEVTARILSPVTVTVEK